MVFSRLSRLLYVICLFSSLTGLAQSNEFDSLTRYSRVHFDLDDTTRVKLLNRLAMLCFQARPVDFRNYTEQALKLSKQVAYTRGTAEAYKNQALYYSKTNSDPVALDLYKHSYSLYRQIGDKTNASNVLNLIGDYYGQLKDYKSQMYFYKTAFKEQQVFKDLHFQGLLLGNLGQASENLRSYETADNYYNKLLKLAASTGDKELLVNAYQHLASVNFITGNHLIALDLARRGLKIIRNNAKLNYHGAGEIDNLIGRIYFDLRNSKKCREYLNASMTIARREHNNASVCQNYFDFYHVDSLTGNYKAAISNFFRYKRMADSVQLAAADQRLAKFQIQFKTERSIAENQRLKKEDERSKSVIAFQNISLVLLISGMIIIIAGLFYLQRTNKQVETKNEIIKKQNQNLAHINLVKDKLFSVVSHDLRGPILQVKGLLSLFQTGNVEDAELRMLTPKVQENLDKTLELVDNLLIWSKNQMQGFKVRPSQFKICQLVNENIHHFESQITAKNLLVYNQLLAEDIIFADREMINIVIRNLLSNAVKFTRDGGLINVFGEFTAESAAISVEDSGVGVNADNLDKIFAFVNYSTPGTQNEKGSGVGLKLCKDLIEMNHGSIWYESKATGGSIFRFNLPPLPQTAPATSNLDDSAS